MQDDPYAPPSAPIRAEKGAAGPVKSILAGLAIDFGGTFVSSMVLGFAYMMVVLPQSTPEEVERLMTGWTPAWFEVVASTIGCGFSVLGGFVCTRMSGRSDYRLGVVLGTCSFVLGFILAMGAYPLEQNLGLGALGFACVMLGTRLGFAKS